MGLRNTSKCQPRILYSVKIFFKSEKNKEISQQGKAETILHWEFHTTRNDKENSSRIRNMTKQKNRTAGKKE